MNRDEWRPEAAAQKGSEEEKEGEDEEQAAGKMERWKHAWHDGGQRGCRRGEWLKEVCLMEDVILEERRKLNCSGVRRLNKVWKEMNERKEREKEVTVMVRNRVEDRGRRVAGIKI